MAKNAGSFIPILFDFDVAQLEQMNVNSTEFKELIVRLYQYINTMSLAINTREGGYFPLYEYINGQLYFPTATQDTAVFRSVFRKVINFGALPNAGTKSVAHKLNITGGYSFTHIYATASDQTGLHYIPIPYASPTLVNNIEINVDATNVNITTGSNRSNFTICYVILEYIKF